MFYLIANTNEVIAASNNVDVLIEMQNDKNNTMVIAEDHLHANYKTRELLDLFNANTDGKQVKKFPNLETAIRRTKKALQDAVERNGLMKTEAPKKAKKAAAPKKAKKAAAPKKAKKAAAPKKDSKKVGDDTFLIASDEVIPKPNTAADVMFRLACEPITRKSLEEDFIEQYREMYRGKKVLDRAFAAGYVTHLILTGMLEVIEEAE